MEIRVFVAGRDISRMPPHIGLRMFGDEVCLLGIVLFHSCALYIYIYIYKICERNKELSQRLREKNLHDFLQI